MNKQQLKNSILQWAIQGKLVPQIASEGTAEDLLKEIRAEKERLVKEGKLKKKDLEVKPIEDDEVPFEIPNSWKWVRIASLCSVVRGGSPRPAGSPVYYNGDIPFMCVADITKDESMYVDSASKSIKEAGLSKTRQVEKGTLLLSNSGATLGVPKITTIGTTFNDGIAAFLDLSPKIQIYLYWYFKSQTEGLRKINQGTAQPNLNTDIIRTMVVPLPPLSEQKRIVAKIEELMPLVEDYGKAQERLEALNQALPEKLKKSILQEAIMGKLVPQDPKEGTADELLAEIRKEKERLVKEGKLKKKDLEVKPIDDNEVPFEIPESWRWVRLGDIVGVYGGKRIPAGSKLTKKITGHKYIRVADMKNESVKLDDIHYVLEKDYEGIKKYTISKDDLYITVAGTIGAVGEIPAELDNANLTENANKLVLLKTEKRYLLKTLLSPYLQKQIKDVTTKVGQPKLAILRIQKLLVPLPPLSEQKRIVEKVEEVMGKIDRMK